MLIGHIHLGPGSLKIVTHTPRTPNLVLGPTNIAISDITTLADVFNANDVDEVVMRKLAEAPFTMSTVEQLANTFDCKADIKTSWVSKSQAYKHQGKFPN